MTMFGVHAEMAAAMTSIAMVVIVSGVVMLCLWIASVYEFALFNLVSLFLLISFGLVGIGMPTGACARSNQRWIGVGSTPDFLTVLLVSQVIVAWF
jgi:hypothetical protein